MASLDPLVRTLAPRQHGLTTRQQLLSLGASPEAVKRAQRSGRLVTIRPGVYLSGGTPMTWHTSVLAACLSIGGVASHRSAAVLWGVDGFRPGTPEVSVRHPGGRAPGGVRVHRVCDLDLAAPTIRDNVPVVGPARLLVDLAAVTDDATLLRALDDLERRRLVTLDQVLDVLRSHARRGKDGSRRLRRVVAGRLDEQDVPDSVLEREFRDVARAFDLEEPEYHVVVHDDEGRIVEVDGLWRCRWVVVELDGRSVHARRGAFDRDAARRLRLQAAGYAVAVVTRSELRTDPEGVTTRLRRLLTIGGPGLRTP
ncbi:MAG: type IV toxin-antitoxin system AbiEi family antitoxin domain-containing protein [Acidimicrobiales bacterium]